MEVECLDSPYGNGGCLWHKRGNPYYLHREDGPARIYCDGMEVWYYHGRSYIDLENMPLNLFLAYCKWEYRKNGS